jgi:hypothetical protein
VLPRWSPGWIADGGDLNLTDSSEFAAKGIGENLSIETFPPRSNPPRDPRRRSGAPGLGREASVDLKRWRQTPAGARVSVGDGKNLGEEELGFLELIHSGGSDFIDDGGRRPSSCTSSSRWWIGCLPELHRNASPGGKQRPKWYSDWATGLWCWAGLMGYGGWAAAR